MYSRHKKKSISRIQLDLVFVWDYSASANYTVFIFRNKILIA